MIFDLTRLIINIKSIIFNLRYLPLSKALKLPIRIYPGFKVNGLKRKNLILPQELTRGMIFLGSTASNGLPNCHGGMIICGRNSVLKFNGGAYIRKGTTLRMDDNGIIEIGKEVYINGNCFIRSDSSIIIGDKSRIGWDVTLNTADGHIIIIDGIEKQQSKPIEIGTHCWIGNHCCVAKGVIMGNDSILAQYSLLTKSFPSNKLLGGIPAKIIRDNANWK